MSLLTSASSLSRSTSLPLSDAACFGPAAAPARPVLRRARAARHSRRRAPQLVVKAQHSQPGRAAAVLSSVRSSCSKFLGRYDPITTGIGSLLVTGYCVVVHEQPVGEALNIAAFATVLGMVMQEMLFNKTESEA